MKKIIRPLMFIMICVAWIMVLTEILKNKLVTDFADVTRKINGYYAEAEDTLDFVFLGSSRMYSAVNPAILWHEYGITGYDFCANEQSLSVTYYYLKEVLKTQSPKAIVVDISLGAQLLEMREPMLHLNIDYLKPSINKLEAIWNNVSGKECFDYIFSIRKWHESWYNLTMNNFNYSFWKELNPYKGYSYVNPNTAYEKPEEFDYPYDMKENMELYKGSAPEENIEWITKMSRETKKKGVDLILITVPDGTSPEQQVYYNGIFEHAQELGVICMNYNLKMTGINHLTTDRATEFTKLLGKDLNEIYHIENKKGIEEYDKEWNKSYEVYQAELYAFDMIAIDSVLDYINRLLNSNYCLFISLPPTTLLVNNDQNHVYNYIFESLSLNGSAVPIDGYVGCVDLEQNYILNEKTGGHQVIEQRNGKYYFRVEIDDYLGEIAVDGESYYCNNGLQLVVYDTVLKRVVDRVYLTPDKDEFER